MFIIGGYDFFILSEIPDSGLVIFNRFNLRCLSFRRIADRFHLPAGGHLGSHGSVLSVSVSKCYNPKRNHICILKIYGISMGVEIICIPCSVPCICKEGGFNLNYKFSLHLTISIHFPKISGSPILILGHCKRGHQSNNHHRQYDSSDCTERFQKYSCYFSHVFQTLFFDYAKCMH